MVWAQADPFFPINLPPTSLPSETSTTLRVAASYASYHGNISPQQSSLPPAAYRANNQATKQSKAKPAGPGRGRGRPSNVTVQETGDEAEEDEDDDGALADQSAMMDEDDR